MWGCQPPSLPLRLPFCLLWSPCRLRAYSTPRGSLPAGIPPKGSCTFSSSHISRCVWGGHFFLSGIFSCRKIQLWAALLPAPRVGVRLSVLTCSPQGPTALGVPGLQFPPGLVRPPLPSSTGPGPGPTEPTSSQGPSGAPAPTAAELEHSYLLLILPRASVSHDPGESNNRKWSSCAPFPERLLPAANVGHLLSHLPKENSGLWKMKGPVADPGRQGDRMARLPGTGPVCACSSGTSVNSGLLRHQRCPGLDDKLHQSLFRGGLCRVSPQPRKEALFPSPFYHCTHVFSGRAS